MVVMDKLFSLPLTLEFSLPALLVLTMLAGIFTAAIAVILVYHWRRFPFEHDTFRTAEHVYIAGVTAFLTLAVLGILIF